MRSTILDIECVPLADAAAYLEPVSAPSNYKDEAKIAAYVQEKTQQELGRCALDPDLCQVVAIGAWSDNMEGPAIFQNANETAMLRVFWDCAAHDRFIGFNILGYDLPVLIRRSQYLGVPVPDVNLDRYRTPHIDLLQVLSFRGAIKYRGLKFYAKRFGLQVPDDDGDGSQVAGWVHEGRWDLVQLHLTRDLERTHGLATRLGYWTPQTQAAEEVVI